MRSDDHGLTPLDIAVTEAEQAIQVLLAVLPVEAAKDIHTAWLDGRTPDFSDATLTARLARILSERFPSSQAFDTGREAS